MRVGMNLRIYLVVALVFLPLFALKAQYEASPGTRTGKPFTVSADLREQYDTNIFTSSTDPQYSWETIMSPRVVFDYPMDETLFQASYEFDATYYANRPGDKWDFAHDALLRVAHSFSPRFDIDVRDNFTYGQESSITSGSVTQRYQGNFFENLGSIAGTYKWTDRFSTVTTYQNTLLQYQDATVADTNNYMQNGISQDFKLTITPETTGVLNFTWTNTAYDTIPRSNNDYIISAGADHYFTPELLFSGRAGVEVTDFWNPAISDQLGPYANLQFIWNYAQKSNVSIGYTHREALTDFSAYGTQRTNQFNGGVTHYITPKLSAGLNFVYILGMYEGDTAFGPSAAALGGSNYDENTWQVNLNLGYEINTWLSAQAGYIHSEIDSDIPTSVAQRSYDREQYYIGLRGTY
jgi:hypothetical protein